jgi:hypothetical protein
MFIWYSGNVAAADRLDIKVDMLYTWIGKAKRGKVGFCEEPGDSTTSDTNKLKDLKKN